MTKIPAGVVADLIAVGREGRPAIPPSLRDADLAWRTLIVPREPWEAVGASLTAAELEALIRGLVLWGVAYGRSGGSATPVAPLYRQYAARFPQLEPALTTWIVDHRINPYEPYGTVAHCEVHSLALHLMLMASDREGRDRSLAAEARRQDEAAIRRAEIATSRLPNAVRRGDMKAVIALLAKGADAEAPLPDGTSLVDLAVSLGQLEIAQLLIVHGPSADTGGAVGIPGIADLVETLRPVHQAHLEYCAAAAHACRREFGHAFTNLDAERQSLLAQDAVAVWYGRSGPNGLVGAWSLRRAVAEWSRRIGGPANLQSHADSIKTMSSGDKRPIQ